MGKIGIILTSHGAFAEGALNCINTIMGEQKDIETVSVLLSSEIEEVKDEMLRKYNTLKKDNDFVFIMTDILSGTPCNVATNLMLKSENVYVFAGFNIPILLELIIKRSTTEAEKLVDYLKETYFTSLNVLSKSSLHEERR